MDTLIFQKEGIYPMLALDHGESFREMLEQMNPGGVDDALIIETKKQILAVLVDQFSGCLLDSDYGLPAYQQLMAEQEKDLPPYLLRLTKQSYGEVEGERITEPARTVEELKAQGASGIKLLLYFNPFGASAKQQKTTAKKALEDAHAQELPFLLEPVTYDLPASQGKTKAELIYETVRSLKEAGVEPDVWKIEYPGSLEDCQRMNELVEATPWILLTRGATYDEFKEYMRIAARAGAKGFLAGRAVWQELGAFTGEEREHFLHQIIPQRFAELTKMVKENQ